MTYCWCLDSGGFWFVDRNEGNRGEDVYKGSRSYDVRGEGRSWNSNRLKGDKNGDHVAVLAR